MKWNFASQPIPKIVRPALHQLTLLVHTPTHRVPLVTHRATAVSYSYNNVLCVFSVCVSFKVAMNMITRVLLVGLLLKRLFIRTNQEPVIIIINNNNNYCCCCCCYLVSPMPNIYVNTAQNTASNKDISALEKEKIEKHHTTSSIAVGTSPPRDGKEIIISFMKGTIW